MDSDDQMEVDSAIPFSSKGKGKAVEDALPYGNETLPWHVAVLH